MRLWHKDLIPVLPRQQLLSQWRECCGIVANIAEKGLPDHILVNKMMDYPVDNFVIYTDMVIKEINNRGCKISDKALTNYRKNIQKSTYRFNNNRKCSLFCDWHNDIYLRQCLYNLEEKYLCGGISNEEWQRICAKFPEYELCS